MVDERQISTHRGMQGLLNRDVIKRCVMAAVLVIPGAFTAKGGTSIAMTLSSAIMGCVVMVIAAMPFALLASSTRFIEITGMTRAKNKNTVLIVIVILYIAGLAIGLTHGFMLAPACFIHLPVLIALAILAVVFTRRLMVAPFAETMLKWMDAIIITSGLLYGAIAGATTFPAAIVLGAFSIACGIVARGMITRSTETNPKSEHAKPSWAMTLFISADVAIVASLLAPRAVPMIYLSLISACFTLIAMFLQERLNQDAPSRAMLRRLVTVGLFFETLALFVGSL